MNKHLPQILGIGGQFVIYRAASPLVEPIYESFEDAGDAVARLREWQDGRA
jgi:hypothetical protein